MATRSILFSALKQNNTLAWDAWVELQALPWLKTASSYISNTTFLLPLVPGSMGTWGGCHWRREQSFVGCTCREFPPKGDPMLGFGGCLGTSLCGLSKLECVVCFRRDRWSCLVLCQEDQLSANGSQGSLHPSLEQLGLALVVRRLRPATSGGVGERYVLMLLSWQSYCSCLNRHALEIAVPLSIYLVHHLKGKQTWQQMGPSDTWTCTLWLHRSTGQGGEEGGRRRKTQQLAASFQTHFSLCCSQTGSCLNQATPFFILNESLQFWDRNNKGTVSLSLPPKSLWQCICGWWLPVAFAFCRTRDKETASVGSGVTHFLFRWEHSCS